MSDAFDEMKKINGYTTNTHSDEKIEKPNCYIEPEGNVIKNFVIKWGRKIVDFLAWLGVFFAALIFIIYFATLIYTFSQDNNYNYGLAQGIVFLCMILIPLVILIITIMSNYFLYLLIDIRDSLKNIDNKTR